MTEMLICLFPYAMIVLGVLLIGHLGLGRQEVHKAVAWASAKPGEQTGNDVMKHFYKGTKSTEAQIGFSEASFETEAEMDPYITVSEETEEPVLPYDQQDVKAAVTNAAIRAGVTIGIGSGGTPEVTVNVNVTREGREMADAGLVDVDGVAQQITGGPGEMGDIEIDFPVDDAMSDDIAAALGGWLRYSRSESSYEYQLDTGEGFREEVAYETESGGTGRTELRKAWRLEAPEDDPDALAFYASSKNEDGDRGNHYDESVDMAAFQDLHPVEGQVITPDQNEEPSMDQNQSDKNYWDRAYLESH